MPLVRAARDRAATEELRTRLDAVLKRLRDAGSADRLRLRRAVEVLERARTAEARALLESLARGEAEARLTEAARLAADRLTRFP